MIVKSPILLKRKQPLIKQLSFSHNNIQQRNFQYLKKGEAQKFDLDEKNVGKISEDNLFFNTKPYNPNINSKSPLKNKQYEQSQQLIHTPKKQKNRQNLANRKNILTRKKQISTQQILNESSRNILQITFNKILKINSINKSIEKEFLYKSFKQFCIFQTITINQSSQLKFTSLFWQILTFKNKFKKIQINFITQMILIFIQFVDNKQVFLDKIQAFIQEYKKEFNNFSYKIQLANLSEIYNIFKRLFHNVKLLIKVHNASYKQSNHITNSNYNKSIDQLKSNKTQKQLTYISRKKLNQYIKQNKCERPYQDSKQKLKDMRDHQFQQVQEDIYQKSQSKYEQALKLNKKITNTARISRSGQKLNIKNLYHNKKNKLYKILFQLNIKINRQQIKVEVYEEQCSKDVLNRILKSNQLSQTVIQELLQIIQQYLDEHNEGL